MVYHTSSLKVMNYEGAVFSMMINTSLFEDKVKLMPSFSFFFVWWFLKYVFGNSKNHCITIINYTRWESLPGIYQVCAMNGII